MHSKASARSHSLGLFIIQNKEFSTSQDQRFFRIGHKDDNAPAEIIVAKMPWGTHQGFGQSSTLPHENVTRWTKHVQFHESQKQIIDAIEAVQDRALYLKE